VAAAKRLRAQQEATFRLDAWNVAIARPGFFYTRGLKRSDFAMRTSARYLITLLVSAFVLTLALSWTPQAANSEQTAPEGNKGFKATVKQAVDLGPEFESMNGRQLRMRLLTLEPGGHIGIHNHKDRPAVVYFLQGTDIVTFGDGAEKVFHAGDTAFASKDTVHWHRNDGKEPLIFVAVDIFHNNK
jgi:quercetin dioxygenase-like cupin family protein